MKDEVYLKKLGEKIEKLMKDKNLSMSDFAETLELNRSHLWRITVGKTNPTINVLRKIAKKLDITIEELVKI